MTASRMRRHRLQPVLGDGRELGVGRQPAGERQRDAAEQPAVVQHHDAVEERRALRVVDGDAASRSAGRSPGGRTRRGCDSPAESGFSTSCAAVVEPADHLQQQRAIARPSFRRRHPRRRRGCAASPPARRPGCGSGSRRTNLLSSASPPALWHVRHFRDRPSPRPRR